MNNKFLEYFGQSLILSLLFLVFCSQAYAQDKLAIPVYFVTDRALVSNASTGEDYGDTQLDQGKVNFGVKNIVLVGKDIASSGSDRITGLGWWAPSGIAPANQRPVVPNSTFTEDDMISKITEIVLSGDSKRPLILFVHGCCQPFKDSIETAANLERAFEAPVLLYSWCSIGPTEREYRENELRQRGGSGTFYNFLSRLEAKVPPEKIVIVAHSMGNRFVHEALKTRQWNRGSNSACPKFRDVIFACADVNAGDFAKDEHNIAFSCDRLVITKNNTDPALMLSKVQRGFYDRLGAPIFSLNRLLAGNDAEVYDIENLYRGDHKLPIPVLVDLVRNREGGWQRKYGYFQKKPHLIEVR